MKACIPVAKDHGLASVVFPHFGSAPVFLVVDTASGAVTAHVNPAAAEHGRAHALDVVGDVKLEAVVVGNIGEGAIERFAAAGIPVYRSTGETVGVVIEGLRAGLLPRIDAATCLGGRSDAKGPLAVHGDGCGC